MFYIFVVTAAEIELFVFHDNSFVVIVIVVVVFAIDDTAVLVIK